MKEILFNTQEEGIMRADFTPERIEELSSGEIFVFGSNLNGNHYGGAARIAYEKFGAEWGVAEGLSGSTYAIPTLDKEMQPVSKTFISSPATPIYGLGLIG